MSAGRRLRAPCRGVGCRRHRCVAPCGELGRLIKYGCCKLGVLLLLFNATRTLSGPPSTGAAIAMEGGAAVQGAALEEKVFFLLSLRRRKPSVNVLV